MEEHINRRTIDPDGEAEPNHFLQQLRFGEDEHGVQQALIKAIDRR